MLKLKNMADKINVDPKKIEDVLTKGVEEVIERKSLLKKLKSGKPLRIKHGIDPTGPKIHIGRAVQFWKLKAFQDLGHKIVLIIGDFTAQIGDASDKQAMRKPLAEKEVKENMRNYKNQIGKILDINKAELHYNSQWLAKLTAKDILSLSMHFTAQQVIQRRNFKERWKKGKPIGLHELDYPLLQGYDSVAVRADVELGGSDQLFNLKVGREIQKIFNQPPQDIITLKMLYGLDGRKMSTSWGNVITITEKPEEIYGKIMSMKDELIPQYFELCTDIPLKEIEAVKKALKNKKVNPRDAKARLAREVVGLYHGKRKADWAAKEFERIFKEKKLPSRIKKVALKEAKINLLDLLMKTKLVSSRSEAKRLVAQGGVKIDGKTKKDWKEPVKIKKGLVLQAGKRKFVKIT